MFSHFDLNANPKTYAFILIYSNNLNNKKKKLAESLAKLCIYYRDPWTLNEVRKNVKNEEIKKIMIKAQERIADLLAKEHNIKTKKGLGIQGALSKASYLKIISLFHKNKKTREEIGKELIEAYKSMENWREIEEIKENSPDAYVKRYALKVLREVANYKTVELRLIDREDSKSISKGFGRRKSNSIRRLLNVLNEVKRKKEME